MPYTYTPALNPLAVAEQGFSTDPETRFTRFTSCIGLLVNHEGMNADNVTAIHLVMVSDDGTVFNNQAADNAVALLGDYQQVVVIGETDLWEDNLPGPYSHLLSQLTHPIVMQRGDGIYGGRILNGQFQVYDNGYYSDVPEAEVQLVPAADPNHSAEAAAALAIPAAAWSDVVYAAQQWANTLQDDVVLHVQVWWVDMSATGLNGLCIPGIVQTAGQGGQTLTRAQAKLQGLLAPDDPRLDMVVALDSTTRWVLGHAPYVPVGPTQFSLATTAMHELCHGLGFLGLCNVDNNTHTGLYSDPNLIGLVQQVAGLTQPAVTIPPYFFQPAPVASRLTPLANLFTYANPNLHKGTAADDYTAFTTAPVSITAQGLTLVHPQPQPTTVLTGQPFQPFTSCDHVVTPQACLMNSSTQGHYFASPDATTLNLLRAIGWTV